MSVKLEQFQVVKDFLSEDELDLAYSYVMLVPKTGIVDDQIPNSPSWYNDPLMQVLHLKHWHKMEELTGMKLIPTYCYLRDYKNGAILKKHTDRPSCEYSATINLGYQADEPWPIYLNDLDGNKHTVILQPGDALLYKGIELEHWRDRFDGQKYTQLFLHYVAEFGPYKEWAWDKRKERSLSFS